MPARILRPYLFLEVDGVLARHGPEQADLFDQGADVVWSGMTPWFSRGDVRRMHQLEQAFDVVWASSWMDECNSLVAKRLLCSPHPMVPMTAISTRKGRILADYAETWPFAWIDCRITDNDEIALELHPWETWFAQTHPFDGLTGEIVAAAIDWACRHTTVQ